MNKNNYRDPINIRLDRELISKIDVHRMSVSRSEYIELVLHAALKREYPHLPDDWSPEGMAEEALARERRYQQTGR